MIVGHDAIRGVGTICENNVVFKCVLDGIISSSSEEGVVAGGTVHGVVAVSTVEDIVSSPCDPVPPNVTVPIEGIIPVATSEDIVASTVHSFVVIADHEVIASISLDSVIARSTDEGIVTRTTFDDVVPCVGVNRKTDSRPGTCINYVVTIPAADNDS